MRLLGLLIALTLCGCPQPGGDLARSDQILGPVAAGEHLVYADTTRDELVIVALDAGDATDLRRVALDLHPERLVPLPDGAGVLALASADEALAHVDLATGATRHFDLGAPYDGLSLSPDAGLAMAYFPTSSKVPLFHNGGELAFVDLSTEAAAAPVTRRTLASLGRSPHGVFVSPPWQGRRLAFVLSDSHVAVLDLSAPDAPEHSIPLVSLGQADKRTPHHVAFAIDPATGVLWSLVLTLEGSTAYALRATPSTEGAGGAADSAGFQIVLQQLAGASPSGDARLVQTTDGTLLALLLSPAQGTLTVTELVTANSRVLSLAVGPSRLALYDDAGRPMAAAYRPSDRALHLVDLEAIATKKDKAVTTRYAESPLSSLTPIPGRPRFIALHPGSTNAISVIDAATGRITPFGQTGAVRSLTLAPDLDRAFLLTRLGATDHVVSLDLATLHPTVATLATQADHLLVLPDASTVAAVHLAPGGRLTLWPADAVADEASRVVPAPLLEGLLDAFAQE